MKIFKAETGHEIFLNESSTPQTLKALVESKTAIPQADQIILNEHGQILESLEDIANQELYLFNRRELPDGQPLPTEERQHMSIEIEPPVPLSIILELEISPGADVEDLKEAYLRSFGSHVKYGKELLGIADKHTKTCERFLNEQFIQAKALNSAVISMNSYMSSTVEVFKKFYSSAQKELASQSSLLNGFADDIATLARIPVHPSISLENKPLIDFVPTEKLNYWVTICQSTFGYLSDQIARLKQDVDETDKVCQQEDFRDTRVDLPKLKQLYEKTVDVINRIDSRQKTLLRNYARVQSIFAELANDDSDTGPKIEAIDQLYRIQCDEYVPEITKYDRYLRETVLYFSDCKIQMNEDMKLNLQEIVAQQNMMISIHTNIKGLDEALMHQRDAFYQLLHVNRMAPCWAATLVEIVRRKEFNSFLVSKAKEIAEIFGKFRVREEQRRQNFQSEIFKFLPTGLISGLEDSPPFCEVSVKNIVDGLPNLTVDDINEFEKIISNMKGSYVEGSSASSAISRIQAAMARVRPNIDRIVFDFEKFLVQSSFSPSIKKLELENKELKVKLSQKTEPSNEVIKATPSYRSNPTKQDEIIKTYEGRIKSLEAILQERYHDTVSNSDNKTLKEEVERLKSANAALTEQLRLEEQKSKESERDLQEIDKQMTRVIFTHKMNLESQNLQYKVTKLEEDSANQTRLLVEVLNHLETCAASLKSADESSEKPIPPIHTAASPDKIRQMMRTVEDDIITQMAQIYNYKASMNESEGVNEEAQTLADQMTTLLRKIDDLEETIQELNVELTESQAKEAILEADLNSMKVLLTRTTNSIEEEHSKLARIETQKFALERENDNLKVQVKELETKIEQTEIMSVPPSTLFSERYTRNIIVQLRTAKEAMEDWAIITRLAFEKFANDMKSWSELDELARNQMQVDRCRKYAPINFDDILLADLEDMPEEWEDYIQMMNKLLKSSYDKIMDLSNLKTQETVDELKELMEVMAKNIKHQISFTEFKPQSLCLFLPTKAKDTLSAFNVNSPHYILNVQSHALFGRKAKKREWVLAYITKLEQKVAADNVYGLTPGTQYFLVDGVPYG